MFCFSMIVWMDIIILLGNLFESLSVASIESRIVLCKFICGFDRIKNCFVQIPIDNN